MASSSSMMINRDDDISDEIDDSHGQSRIAVFNKIINLIYCPKILQTKYIHQLTSECDKIQSVEVFGIF